MRTSLFFMAVTLVGISTQAAETYLVEPMTCTGNIQGNYRNVHESYHQIGIYASSFRSARRDGALVLSLREQTSFARPQESLNISTMGGSIGRSLAKSGNIVTSASGMSLRITGTQTVNGQIVNTLEGTYGQGGTYEYRVSCRATVVSRPSDIVDALATSRQIAISAPPTSATAPIFQKVSAKAQSLGMVGYDPMICYNNRGRAVLAGVSSWNAPLQAFVLENEQATSGRRISPATDYVNHKYLIMGEEFLLKFSENQESEYRDGLSIRDGQLTQSTRSVPVKCYTAESGLESVR